MLTARRRETVPEETFGRIAEMIREGAYGLGDRLPGERDLARQLGVGRTSVREAIKRLETIGLLESRQGRGTYVKDPSSEMVQAALVPHLFPDRETQEKLFDLRMMIEVEAAGRAALHASGRQIETLRRFKEGVERSIAREDIEGMIVADFEFHRELLIATGNDILVNLMDGIMDLLREMRQDGADIPVLHAERIASHRAILKAVESRDSEAAREAMKEHLTGVYERVKQFWAEKGREGLVESGQVSGGKDLKR